MIYLANKVHGEYEYVGVDWNSDAIPIVHPPLGIHANPWMVDGRPLSAVQHQQRGQIRRQ